MKKMLSEYLLFFAKFDYALCRAGFAKTGRKINGDAAGIHTWEADWDKFIDAFPENFFEDVKSECTEILKDDGPNSLLKNPRHRLNLLFGESMTIHNFLILLDFTGIFLTKNSGNDGFFGFFSKLLGMLLVRRIDKTRAAYIKTQLDRGGLPLWIKLNGGGYKEKVIDILYKHNARDVHTH